MARERERIRNLIAEEKAEVEEAQQILNEDFRYSWQLPGELHVVMVEVVELLETLGASAWHDFLTMQALQGMRAGTLFDQSAAALRQALGMAGNVVDGYDGGLGKAIFKRPDDERNAYELMAKVREHMKEIKRTVPDED